MTVSFNLMFPSFTENLSKPLWEASVSLGDHPDILRSWPVRRARWMAATSDQCDSAR